MPFNTPPNKPTIPLKPYEVHVPQADIDDLRARLAHPARHRTTWENTNGPHHLGVTKEWMEKAVKRWRELDWRDTEREINSFPNFMATVEFEGASYDVHFIGLFSEKRDAVPLMLNHGWPGSVLEFVPLLKHIKKTYTSSNMPYHFIVPSLIGYGFSSQPPIDRAFAARDCAGAFDAMMRGLGFGTNSHHKGYIAQGGDIGSFVTRQLSTFDACIGIHLNFFPLLKSKYDMSTLDETDKKCLQRANMWESWGLGYLVEHATKPATIGAILESSPVAVLAWIGEKLQYADIPNNLDWTLSEISLYWFTNTAATCIWHYRAEYGRDKDPKAALPKYISKPMGYTQCIGEIYPTPAAMVKTKANLVFARRHLEGGHFIALEKPLLLWNDVKDYIDVVVPGHARL